VSAPTTSAIAYGVGAAACLILTPVAIAVARRTGFYDRPREYRKHKAATPFLGGAAVIVAFLVAALVTRSVTGDLIVPVIGALVMWAIGTVDDGRSVAPKWRVLAAIAAAIALYVAGLGWNTALGPWVNVPLTALWIVGMVNAFNLMDNLDGACSTVAAVAAAGVGVLAAVRGQTAIAGLAFALCGACSGFLPWNLAGPARIFLGDGGSMPLGFLVAALAMAVSRHDSNGNAGILVAALLAGLPILDVALVSLSRTRRGVTLVTGGRDHLTHRILLALGSPWRVAGVLVAAQGTLCAAGILGYELGGGAVAWFALVAFLAGVGAIGVLDTERWRPAGIARASIADELALPVGAAARVDEPAG